MMISTTGVARIAGILLIGTVIFSVGDVRTQEAPVKEPTREESKQPVRTEAPAATDKKTTPTIKNDATPKKSVIDDSSNTTAPTTRKARRERAQAEKGKYFTLNFKDVEINEFLNVMSQLIGKNIIIDEKIRGKVTISSAKKIPVTQAYDIMKSILEVKGLAVIETENLIKIVPIKEAIRKNVEVMIDDNKKKPPHDDDRIITYLLELRYADANEIQRVLMALKPQNTDIVVYKLMNILIFSGTSSDIKGLVRIANELDKKVEDEVVEEKKPKGNIHVVHLENANAEQLANVLSRIPFSDKALIQTGQPTQPQTPERKPVKESSKSSRVTQTQKTGSPTSPQTKLSIIANKETNSLIITATPEEYNDIRRIIKELDIVREQVYIESLIVEVTAENSWGLGIDWMLGAQSGENLYGGSSIMGNPPSYKLPDGFTGKKLAVPLSTGFQLGYLADKSVLGYVLLNATGTDKNFNVLSTPQLLTTDNQEAELNVGQEIPVPTNNRISDTGTQFYTYEYKSVGVKFKINPHITQKERITLDLYLEVNSVLGTTQQLPGGSIIPPSMGRRDMKTKISVHDGQTIVVGGLITNTKSDSEVKVPLLGDIPLLGWFFKRKTTEYKKTNLLVFITPYIVTKKDKIDSITRHKKEEQSRIKLRD
ncbi:MAG TPA: secretin N-terminal domain-containing protein [Spirochaetota bacterium]|nr:secretin N-terminal domain-containing protein [Spirochaetota bacterium]HNT10694.1 secretin N-terminal domain-containing protein [Spirochaetota bacterium]